MAAIPQRSTAASRPTVHLVLQPSRVKLWPFSGGQLVNIEDVRLDIRIIN